MRVEQISKEIIDKDNQVFHCQKRSDKEGKPYDVRTVSKISLIHVYFHIYTARLTQIRYECIWVRTHPYFLLLSSKRA